MSCGLEIEIEKPEINYIEIETCVENNVNNIEIEKYDMFNVEIITSEIMMVYDLPDNIPLSKILFTGYGTGYSGLDNYLDQYQFDCGYPFNE